MNNQKEKSAYEFMLNHPQLREFTIVDNTPRKMYFRLAYFGYYYENGKWLKKEK